MPIVRFSNKSYYLRRDSFASICEINLWVDNRRLIPALDLSCRERNEPFDLITRALATIVAP